NARRTTVIHLLFNIFGTIIFMVICQLTPFVDFVINMFPNSPSAQIANAHLIFKVVTTIILFPFAKQLVKLSILILPDKAGDKVRPSLLERSSHFSPHGMGNVAIIISGIREEVTYMYGIAVENVKLSFDSVLGNTMDYDKLIHENEDKLDTLNAQISQYISTVISMPMPLSDSEIISGYFRIVGNIERIGDHAMNLAGYVKFLRSKEMPLTSRALSEISDMKRITLDALSLLDGDRRDNADFVLIETAKAEQEIDDVTDNYRLAQLDRMKTTTCSAEASVIYSEMLTDIERVGDHLLNIAQDFSKMYSK
ncbi:MAG: PhoU domain-containing protein, partial [Oscillospiraceae bacterium]